MSLASRPPITRGAGLRAPGRRLQLWPGTTFEPVECDGVPCEWIHTPGSADSPCVYLHMHGGG